VVRELCPFLVVERPDVRVLEDVAFAPSTSSGLRYGSNHALSKVEVTLTICDLCENPVGQRTGQENTDDPKNYHWMT
jgi:hypothetical protein